MKQVAIYGAGGLGRLVLDILMQRRRCRPVAFLDSADAKHGSEVERLPVIGGLEKLATLRAAGVTGIIVAIGDNAERVRVADQVRQCGLELVSAIHPLASISRSASLGEHLIIGARVTICVHAVIGPHCVLSAGSIIEHNSVLGAGVMLHPATRLAGGVTIDDLAAVGIGACVIPGRHVGRATYIEPGAVVIRDLPAGATAGGVPARVRPPQAPRFVPEPKAPGEPVATYSPSVTA